MGHAWREIHGDLREFELMRPLIDEEIVEVLTSMSSDKASGPDGFPPFSSIDIGSSRKKYAWW